LKTEAPEERERERERFVSGCEGPRHRFAELCSVASRVERVMLAVRMRL
jgi:hypothetical protein